jgi:hypothetical protein
MTALANDLASLGVPPGQASRLPLVGVVKSITGVGTAQGGSSPKVYGGQFCMLTTAGGATAATIDSSFPVGETAWVVTITSTTGLLFPPSGAKFDNGSTDASASIAQNKGRLIYRASPTLFYTLLGG